MGTGHTARHGQRLFDILVAAALLLLALPIMALVALAIAVVDGRPVLHRGQRLGRQRCTFSMLKFRTLVPDAEAILGVSLESPVFHVRTKTGGFLRETRLDELPQLWNVLRGDMTFVGPRPVRPSVYEERCRTIPDYDRRFGVRPGIIGYSQLLTPHSAPKRLRSRIDNRLIAHPLTLQQQLGLMLLTWSAVVRKVVIRVCRVARLRQFRRTHGIERRRLERQPGRETTVLVHCNGDILPPPAAVVVDVNDQALRLRTREPIRVTEDTMLEVRIRDRGGAGPTRRKTARCRIGSLRSRRVGSAFDHVVSYEPVSEHSRYVIDQYLLNRSLLPSRPRRAL